MAQRLNYPTNRERQHKKTNFGTMMSLLAVAMCAFVFFMYTIITMHVDDATPMAVNNPPPSNKINRQTGNRPVQKSTSKWRLWHEMTPTEQESELEQAIARAAPYGKLLGGEKDTSKFHNNCPTSGEKPMLLGKGGEHMVRIFQN
jgi:hypothetical protein